MPIRPEKRGLYTPEYHAAADYVKHVRAGGRCECTGECGRVSSHLLPEDGRCRNVHGRQKWGRVVTQGVVILQAAHLDHDETNTDPDNLRAFCPGCHLEYDRAHHAETAHLRQIAELGMDPLFEVDPVATRRPLRSAS